MTRFLALLILLLFHCGVHAAVWQYSIKTDDKNGRAFLWIPPKCEKIRGIIIGQQVILEDSQNTMKTHIITITALSSLAFLQAQTPSTERIGIENDYAKINAAAEKASQIPLLPAAEISARAGMPNLFAKLDKGGPVTIAYYGGSITAGPGWRTHTLDWFRKQYPDAKINELNASLGGSGSLVGVFRADHDLVAPKPDAVFIEFSLNDVADVRDRPSEVAGALEGIIRKLRLSKPDTDVCLAYTLHSSAVDLIHQGKFSASVSLHESIAAHYGIPTIHMGIEAARLAAENKLVFTAPKTPGDKDAQGRTIFTNDGTHPTETGHLLNGQTAIRGLEMLRRNAIAKPHPPLPAVPMGDHTVTWTLLDEVPDKEKMLAVKKTDQDLRDHPEKYANNTFSVGQIIVLGDILDENGNLLR